MLCMDVGNPCNYNMHFEYWERGNLSVDNRICFEIYTGNIEIYSVQYLQFYCWILMQRDFKEFFKTIQEVTNLHPPHTKALIKNIIDSTTNTFFSYLIINVTQKNYLA